MSGRFTSPDLSALGDVPAVVPVDFEEIRQRRAEYLKAALLEVGLDFDVTALETSPLMRAVSRGGGYEETLYRQAINESIRALSLATATGGDLDHIGATYFGVSRQTSLDADGNPQPVDDDRQRAFTALAPEAFSTAGPLGAYVFHALELDGVADIADAWAYSEDDGATYSDGLHADAYSAGERPSAFSNRADDDPVLAPEILIVIVGSLGYGEAGSLGTVDQALLDRTYTAVSGRDVRPLGDTVRIEPAEIVTYAVECEITYARGADPQPLIDEAKARIAAYVAARRRVGISAQRLGIGGAAHISNVESVNLIQPAEDVAGGSKQAPECISIVVRAIEGEGSWS